MSAGIPVTAALLTGIAGAGILLPFARPRIIQRLADPLEDERLALLRTLRELDQDRATMGEDDYRVVRRETEARAVRVMRGLQAREDARELAVALRHGRLPSGRFPRLKLPGVVAAVAIAGATVALLVPALVAREPGGLITGQVAPPPALASSLVFFEKRVRDHPDDLTARLDLGQQYLSAGDMRLATQQYLEVVKLDPKNPEANTRLGYLVYVAGLPEQGIRAVDRALEADPNYPEALYLKGLILMQGLNRRVDAAAAFRAYLQGAPFGSHRAEVERLLQQTQGGGP